MGKRRLVAVRSKSLLGKNRIREHGHMWYEDSGGDVPLGRKAKLTSVKTGYTRWLDHSDSDFVVDKAWGIPQKER